MKADCTKCGSTHAWYEKTYCDLTLCCSCGFRKVVYTTLKDMEIMHNDPVSDIKLPKPGTHLHNTLTCLWSIEPANSREVTDTLWLHSHEYTVSDVSSYLMMLRSRGLVQVIDYRRGVPGGSTWECTDVCLTMLGG